MLSCQHFRRRHQRSLVSVLHDFRQCQRRHGGFAAAHVSLDEALHRDESLHVVLNIRKGLLLPGSQMKGEIIKHRPHQLSRRRALDAHHMALPLLPKKQDACLHEEEFLKGRTAPGLLLLLPVLRIVHGPGCLQPAHEMLPFQSVRRQVFIHILHLIQGNGNHIPHLSNAYAFG